MSLQEKQEPVLLLFQIVDGVLCFFRRKLFAVFGNQLVVNCGLGHRHIFIICFRFFKSIGFSVSFNVVNSVLRRIGRETLAIFGRQLIVDRSLGHVHHVGISLGF